jgi:hypothetical protein
MMPPVAARLPAPMRYAPCRCGRPRRLCGARLQTATPGRFASTRHMLAHDWPGAPQPTCARRHWATAPQSSIPSLALPGSLPHFRIRPAPAAAPGAGAHQTLAAARTRLPSTSHSGGFGFLERDFFAPCAQPHARRQARLCCRGRPWRAAALPPPPCHDAPAPQPANAPCFAPSCPALHLPLRAWPSMPWCGDKLSSSQPATSTMCMQYPIASWPGLQPPRLKALRHPAHPTLGQPPPPTLAIRLGNSSSVQS